MDTPKICKDSVTIIAEQSIIFMVNMIPSLTIMLSFFLNNDMKRAFHLQIHSCCADHILKFWVGLAIIDSQGLHSEKVLFKTIDFLKISILVSLSVLEISKQTPHDPCG